MAVFLIVVLEYVLCQAVFLGLLIRKRPQFPVNENLLRLYNTAPERVGVFCVVSKDPGTSYSRGSILPPIGLLFFF